MSSASKAQAIQRFQQVHSASLGELTEIIREGVQAASVQDLATLLGVPLVELSNALGIPSPTRRRKVQSDQVLALDQGERIIGLQRIVGQVQSMVEDCGDPSGFDAGIWTGRWLRRPAPCLGGKRPLEYLDTVTGQQLLSGLLRQTVTGTYA